MGAACSSKASAQAVVAPVPAPPALKPDSEEEGSRDSRDQQVAARRSSHSKTSTSASPPKPRAKARGEYEDLDDTAGSRKGGHDLGGRGLHEAANGGAAAAAPAPPSPAGAGSTALPPIALHAPASPRALPTSFWGGPAPDLAAPRGRVSEIKAHGPRHRRSGSQSSQTSQQGGGRPGSGQVSQRRHRRKGKGKGGAEFDVSNSWEEQLPTLLAQSSLGNVVGGEALGLPGPRYPAPKRTQQQQFEAADSAADAAAAVLAAAALRCADRHAPGNSLATCDSWVADAVEHDLELSLPPSCFTSNINTRVGSRVDGELREQLLLSQAGASESQQGLPGHKQPLRSARSRQWSAGSNGSGTGTRLSQGAFTGASPEPVAQGAGDEGAGDRPAGLAPGVAVSNALLAHSKRPSQLPALQAHRECDEEVE